MITEKMPARRPLCPGCGRQRIAVFDYYNEGGVHQYHRADAVRRRFYGWKGYGHFCTMVCATAYANAVVAARGGPRYKRKK